ncbi:general substrate transporter [Talaromyces proteolyticus]|uniref:General substrate transporter n=1 Tax=Talaromyces proteolyticus TaxID=1131652 RepID=A0AAD4KPY8_9EURO|nr:general substrate transporter [Talaromyces proteolyticus]KAH8696595.1 general substrate transporter [Talaromyces proteolyticus]
MHGKIGSPAAVMAVASQANQPLCGEADVFFPLSTTVPGISALTDSARAATRAEQKMTFRRAFRLYPKAILWSILLSSTIIMDGYDMSLLTSFFTFPTFQKSYGELLPATMSQDTSNQQQLYQISPAWQAGLINGTQVGVILGLIGNGLVADHFGYRRTLIAALVALGAFVFLAVFARNITTLLVAQVLCGIPWGVFQTLSVSYAAEVMPVALRGHFLSYINLCWVLGQTLGVVVIRSLVDTESDWAYRLPFALQWVFIVIIIIGVSFSPESPWWLIRQNKLEEARKSLLRLTSRGAGALCVDETVAMMSLTNKVEQYLGYGNISYRNCFRGVDLRRTEITTMVWATQQLCGSTLTFYAAYFYEQAGFRVHGALDLALGMYGLSIGANVISWLLLPWVGRRRLYLVGASLSLTPAQSWVLGSLIVVLTFIYQMTLGPVCYMLVAEIPSTRLRVKTVVVGRVVYNITSIITNTIAPRMLNPTAWNWKGKSCFLFVVTTILCLVWCYFRLPEPFGLSFLEIDILFEKRASAAKFRVLQRNLERSGYNDISRSQRGNITWQRY